MATARRHRRPGRPIPASRWRSRASGSGRSCAGRRPRSARRRHSPRPSGCRRGRCPETACPSCGAAARGRSCRPTPCPRRRSEWRRHWDGSVPTSSSRKTDLPEPEAPMMTSDSPLPTSTSSPFRTTLRPKDFFNPLTDIFGVPAGDVMGSFIGSGTIRSGNSRRTGSGPRHRPPRWSSQSRPPAHRRASYSR